MQICIFTSLNYTLFSQGRMTQLISWLLIHGKELVSQFGCYCQLPSFLRTFLFINPATGSSHAPPKVPGEPILGANQLITLPCCYPQALEVLLYRGRHLLVATLFIYKGSSYTKSSAELQNDQGKPSPLFSPSVLLAFCVDLLRLLIPHCDSQQFQQLLAQQSLRL